MYSNQKSIVIKDFNEDEILNLKKHVPFESDDENKSDNDENKSDNDDNDDENKSDNDDNDDENKSDNLIKEEFAKNEVPKENINKITFPYLTKFEKTLLLGFRTEQIMNGSAIMLDLKKINKKDPFEIAKAELEAKVIPFKIKRNLPNGKFEIWKISQLTLI